MNRPTNKVSFEIRKKTETLDGTHEFGTSDSFPSPGESCSSFPSHSRFPLVAFDYPSSDNLDQTPLTQFSKLLCKVFRSDFLRGIQFECLLETL